MKTKHVEGPWWLDNNNEILCDPMGNIKAGKAYPISPSNDGRANGRLMAKAPELLEALEGILADFLEEISEIEPDDWKLGDEGSWTENITKSQKLIKFLRK